MKGASGQGQGEIEVASPPVRTVEGTSLVSLRRVPSPSPTPQLCLQVELGKSDSYLMTQNSVLFEHPVVTGELKGADAGAQVMDLWPRRSGQGQACVVTMGDWKDPKTVRTGCNLFSTFEPVTPHALTHTPNPIRTLCLTVHFGYLHFGVSREQKAELAGINLLLDPLRDEALEIHDFLFPRIQ